ncbi:MAG: S9 family peptidase [Anaerolineae bacterium]|nr:S9 family peptidase [Anaerolineae bacterium]
MATPLSAQDFYEIDLAGDPQISPDGKWVAFVRLSVDKKENTYNSAIWLAPTDGGKARQFTAGEKKDNSPCWSPDGEQLAFVSSRAGDKPQIYVIPVDGGEARQLTRTPNGVKSPAWSPDGTRIAFNSSVDADERAFEDSGEEPPADPDERALWKEKRKREREKKQDPRLIARFPYRVGTSYIGDRYAHLYIIDLEEKKARRVTDGDREYTAPVWTLDGTALLTTVNRDPDGLSVNYPSDVVRIPLRDDEIVAPEPVVSQAGTHDNPKLSPDGQWIAYVTGPEQRVSAINRNLAIVPAAGGEPRLLTEALDIQVANFKWSADSQSLYLTYNSWGSVGIHRVSLDGTAEQVVEGDRVVLGFDVAQDRLAFVATAPDIPADLYLSDLDGQDERRCTEINAQFLAERWLSLPEEVRYTRPDGTRIQGWVMYPPDFDPAKRYPLAVEIHGGPHGMYDNRFWHEFQSIAGAGYIVFFCNPRGSDGYGQAFRDAIYGRWGEEDSGDILAGVDGLIKRSIVDEDKLVVTGGSYGGFMTAWLIGHDKRFKAAVSQRGVYALAGFYGVTDIPLFIEHEFDATPWGDVETLWKHSPLAYVDQIETPLLILHSQLDFRVPISEGEQLYLALKRLGREVAFLQYPREGHELSRSGEPRHRVDRIERIIDWFDTHI